MTGMDQHGEKIRAAYLAAGDEAAREPDCPGDDAIWAASRGEAPPEETRALLEHIQGCRACSRSLAMARALAREAGIDSSIRAFPERRRRLLYTAGALAASLLLTVAVVMVLRSGPGDGAVPSLESRVQTTLWRAAPGGDQPLGVGGRHRPGDQRPAPGDQAPASGDPAPRPDNGTLAPGDRLYLTVKSDAALYLYVINTDAAGRASALFPVDGAQWSNPLPAGSHRLPGDATWQYDSWEATAPAGPETFQVIASLEPLPALEAALARVDAAAGEFVRGEDPASRAPGAAPAGDAPDLASVLADLKTADRDDLVIREILLPGAP